MQAAQVYLLPDADEVGRRADDDLCELPELRQPVEVLLSRWEIGSHCMDVVALLQLIRIRKSVVVV